MIGISEERLIYGLRKSLNWSLLRAWILDSQIHLQSLVLLLVELALNILYILLMLKDLLRIHHVQRVWNLALDGWITTFTWVLVEVVRYPGLLSTCRLFALFPLAKRAAFIIIFLIRHSSLVALHPRTLLGAISFIHQQVLRAVLVLGLPILVELGWISSKSFLGGVLV